MTSAVTGRHSNQLNYRAILFTIYFIALSRFRTQATSIYYYVLGTVSTLFLYFFLYFFTFHILD